MSAKKKREDPFSIELGRDALAGCRSITFDPGSETVTLRCAAFEGLFSGPTP